MGQIQGEEWAGEEPPNDLTIGGAYSTIDVHWDTKAAVC